MVGMEEGRGQEVGRVLGVGILDTLVVAQVEGAHMGGKLDSPGELLGVWERDLEERQDWQDVDRQGWDIQG